MGLELVWTVRWPWGIGGCAEESQKEGSSLSLQAELEVCAECAQIGRKKMWLHTLLQWGNVYD